MDFSFKFMMSSLVAFTQKAAYEKQVEEEVQKAREEAEHQKRLKEEEEQIRATQVMDREKTRG